MLDLIIMIAIGFLFISIIKLVYRKYIGRLKFGKVILAGILLIPMFIAYIVDTVFSVDFLGRFQMFFVMVPLSFVEDIFPPKKRVE